MPGEASGRVTLNSRSSRPAPRVRAASSSPGSAASSARRTARTITGKVITAQARLAPAVVNTNRTPNQSLSSAPSGPRMPNTISSSQPVTTGGSTSGRCTRAFSIGRPGNRVRARSHAVSTATGSPNPTARAATARVSRTACHSSDDNMGSEGIGLFHLEAAPARLRDARTISFGGRTGKRAGN